MIEKTFILFCEIVLICVAAGGISIILLATWYDFRIIATRSRLQQAIQKLRQPRQPQIAILLYAYNNATTVVRCFDSIRHSRYKRYSITIINNKSTDNTSSVIKQYMKRHKKTPITVITKRTFTEPMRVLRMAYKKAPASDLVLLIDANTTLSPTALKEYAAHFTLNASLEALHIRRSYEKDVTISTLFNHALEKSINTYHKATNSLHIDKKQFGTVSVMYRSACISRNFSKFVDADYTSTHTLQSTETELAKTRNASFIMLHLLTFLMMTYFFYAAATLQSNVFLILSWLLFSFWILATIWSDEKMLLAKKAELTFCAPIIYFLLYIHVAVGIFNVSKNTFSKILFSINKNVKSAKVPIVKRA